MTDAGDNAGAFFDAGVRMLQEGFSLQAFAQQHRAAAPFPDARWRAIAAAGWFRLLLSEREGGLGQGLPELGALFRAAGLAIVRGPLLDHTVSLPLLVDAVGAARRGEFEGALDGEHVVAWAEPLPAPFGRSDEVVRFDAGRLSGTATLVPFGQAASAFVVVALQGDVPCLAWVPADRVTPQGATSLDACVDYATVRFAALPVGAPDILLQGEDARRLLQRRCALQRLAIAAEMAGAVEAMTTMAVEYAKVRRQFGRPIGSFQALQHMLATLAVRASALTHLVTWSLRDAQRQPERLDEIAALAKAYAGEVGRYAAEEAMQVHGGIGFTEELPLHLYYRRVLSAQGWLGETNALLRAVGTAVVMGADDDAAS